MSKFYQKKYVSKYTGKEIDVAVAKAATSLQNPMTAAGDLIVGGEDGAAERLAKGTDGKVLKMVSGSPAWADDSAGMTNPMTAAGDLIVGGADGAAGRLGKGTDGQVLSMVSGAPAWAAASGAGSRYWHSVFLMITSNNLGNLKNSIGYLIVINDSSTAFTSVDAFITYLSNNQNAKFLFVNGAGIYNTDEVQLAYVKYGTATQITFAYFGVTNNTIIEENVNKSSLYITDDVSQIF